MAVNSLFGVGGDQWYEFKILYLSEEYWDMRMLFSSFLKILNDVHCLRLGGKEFQTSGPLCFNDFWAKMILGFSRW